MVTPIYLPVQITDPLTAALQALNLDVVNYLLETCHAVVNLPDSKGNTPLHQVVWFKKNNFIQLHEVWRYEDLCS